MILTNAQRTLVANKQYINNRTEGMFRKCITTVICNQNMLPVTKKKCFETICRCSQRCLIQTDPIYLYSILVSHSHTHTLFNTQTATYQHKYTYARSFIPAQTFFVTSEPEEIISSCPVVEGDALNGHGSLLLYTGDIACHLDM